MQTKELERFFTPYFGQRYELFTEVDDDEPFIPQIVASFKKDSSIDEVEKTIKELKELIALNYSEEKLEDEIYPSLGIDIYVPAFELTHKEFLIEVLKELESKDNQNIHSNESYYKELRNSTEGVLGCKTVEEIIALEARLSQQQPAEDDLSNFEPYVYPPKSDHIIPTGIEGLLTVYFAKDYDELVEQYGKMRLITNVVAKYKQDRHSGYVRDCLNEVERLVAREHDEKYLRDLIANQYGVKIPISKLGGSYQIFLERLHEELLGKRIYS